MDQSPSLAISKNIPNRILRSLESEVYAQLVPHLEMVRFPLRRIVYEPGMTLDHVYFPNQGVLSMLTVLENGDLVEIATVGNEGMVDLSVFLGLEVSSSRLLVQVPGDTLRMRTEPFLELVDRNPGLRTALGAYMVSMFILVSQSAACNRLHPVEQRCARWILMTHDRVDANTFPLTQDFLASYSRGTMTVLDREGLEDATCECYALVRAQFDGMPGGDVARPGQRRLSSGHDATTD